jgi:hypothetical protein
MVKTKKIKDEGMIIEVEEEKVMPEVIEISHTQAKKLTKKPMSEKQQANINKLVEANRLKWEQKKKEKEEAERKLNEDKVKVVVKPKRVYPSKKVVSKEESDDEYKNYHSASEDGNYQKKKRITKPKKYTSEEETTEYTETEQTETEPELSKPKLKRYSKIKKYDKQINDKLENIERKLQQNSFISSRVFGMK